MGGKDSLSDTTGSALESMNSRETAHLSVDSGSRKSIGWEDEDKHPGILLTLKEPFLKAFRVMDKELKLHPKIDCFCSGTTAVILVKQGHDLVVGNIGDSRAVLEEAERIRQCKGRVFALQNEPEVPRVWLPNNNSPGLAMSRAFGDFCLKDFGLISVPEISYHCLTDKDEFVVLATDGIWDVLTNEEVTLLHQPHGLLLLSHLVEHAVQAWRSKYPFAKVDDCAVVCLFLHPDGSSAVSTSEEQAASMSKPIDFSSDKGDGSRQDALDHSCLYIEEKYREEAIVDGHQELQQME
ncbi:LOW QUALITY PROTEIN: PPM-type phosphatase-like domain [Dillenia turbinata]|uniref:PPM-type phosphatase-like domain n=1 Tax=Dillenia turbinata TaxID=194707 RepID=A0AAN8UM91_9MAGN